MVFELSIDHLVLAARSRKEGMQYVSEHLDVTPELGGKHSVSRKTKRSTKSHESNTNRIYLNAADFCGKL